MSVGMVLTLHLPVLSITSALARAPRNVRVCLLTVWYLSEFTRRKQKMLLRAVLKGLRKHLVERTQS